MREYPKEVLEYLDMPITEVVRYRYRETGSRLSKTLITSHKTLESTKFVCSCVAPFAKRVIWVHPKETAVPIDNLLPSNVELLGVSSEEELLRKLKAHARECKLIEVHRPTFLTNGLVDKLTEYQGVVVLTSQKEKDVRGKVKEMKKTRKKFRMPVFLGSCDIKRKRETQHIIINQVEEVFRIAPSDIAVIGPGFVGKNLLRSFDVKLFVEQDQINPLNLIDVPKPVMSWREFYLCIRKGEVRFIISASGDENAINPEEFLSAFMYSPLSKIYIMSVGSNDLSHLRKTLKQAADRWYMLYCGLDEFKFGSKSVYMASEGIAVNLYRCTHENHCPPRPVGIPSSYMDPVFALMALTMYRLSTDKNFEGPEPHPKDVEAVARELLRRDSTGWW